MMLGYKVALISDCSATLTDEEHGAALNTFMMFFGDVMTSDEAVATLNAAPVGGPMRFCRWRTPSEIDGRVGLLPRPSKGHNPG
jgi:hypothetical protein